MHSYSSGRSAPELRPGSLLRYWDLPQRILRFSRPGPPSGDPLVNLLLLLWCEHFENLDVFKPLVAPAHCIRGLRAQLLVIGQGSQMGLCLLTDLTNLRLLVACERQSFKQ